MGDPSVVVLDEPTSGLDPGLERRLMTLLRELEWQPESAAKKHVVAMVKEVAEQLRNTPAVCRKCYIHPQVIDSYLARDLVLEVQEEIADELDASGLQAEEARVLRFLEQRLADAA